MTRGLATRNLFHNTSRSGIIYFRRAVLVEPLERDWVSNLDRIAERLIAGWRPTELDISVVIGLYKRMGWDHSRPRGGSSHHKFRKSGRRNVIVAEHRNKVLVAAVEELAEHVGRDWRSNDE
jgi:hypothetical protein